MITLLVDAGNSRLKLGWLNTDTGERETAPCALPYTAADELQHWLTRLPALPGKVLGVNVAGPDTASLLLSRLTQAELPPPVWLQPKRDTPLLRNGYEAPDRLGADRWAAMLGLASLAASTPDAAGRPLLLAIFGTATTIDALLPPESGTTAYRHLGGLILPGPTLMADALHRGTAQLPLGQATAPCDFPRDTAHAIANGLAAAQAGAVLRQWQALRNRAQGMAPRVYVSGGAWPAIEAELHAALAGQQADIRAPYPLAAPVLDGLAWLAARP